MQIVSQIVFVLTSVLTNKNSNSLRNFNRNILFVKFAYYDYEGTLFTFMFEEITQVNW